MRGEVSLLVECLIVLDGPLAVLSSRDAGSDALVRQRLAIPIAIIAAVSDQRVSTGQRRQHDLCTAMVADLALGQQQYQRLALSIADRVQFRVQATLDAANTAGNAPFSSKLAAVR